MVARIALGLAATVVVVLGLAQLLGPAIAARIVREKVGKYGTVRSVTVKAWPAIKLLWREVDEVRVSAGQLTISPEETVALLREGSGAETVSASAASVNEGGVRLTDMRFEKHGSAMRAEGVMSEEAVRQALPAGVGISLLGSGDGTVEVRVSGGLFGVGASVDAVAKGEDGKLVARPTGLFSGLKVTVFDDPSVYVEGVEAKALPGKPGEGKRYALRMWASLQ